jgi:hypothetical protein
MALPFSQEWWGCIRYWVCGSPTVYHWRELIISGFMGHNQSAEVPGVQDPDINRSLRPCVIGVFCTDKNIVVKIMHSSYEMVLRTTKHTMIYPSSGPSLEVIPYV